MAEYLKKIGQMENEELARYWTAVERWRSKDLPRLCAVADAWSETEIKIFEEGLILISALKQARGFVESAMQFRVQKRLDNIRGFIEEARGYIRRNHPDIAKIVEDAEENRNGRNRKVTTMVRVIPPPRTDEDGEPEKIARMEIPAVEGRRPEHLSQYLYLLPVKIQKESENLQGWYMKMASDRTKLEMLCKDERSSKADRTYYANETADMEDRILNFWKRVDMAWEECQGKRVSEEARRRLDKETRDIRRIDGENCEKEGSEHPYGTWKRSEIEKMEDGEEKEKARQARIKRNRKYVKANAGRVNISPSARGNLTEALTELHDWGLVISKVFRERLRSQWGIVVPDSWFETPETIRTERREKNLRRQREYYHKRKEADRRQREEDRKEMIEGLISTQ